MRYFAIVVLWVALSACLFAYEPIAPEHMKSAIGRGKWGALILAAFNVIRGVFRYYLTHRASPRDDDDDRDGDLPPKPIVHPEFRVDDDKSGNGPNPPPGAFKA